MLNPNKQNAVFCPVCGFVDFWEKNVTNKTVYPVRWVNGIKTVDGKCEHCGTQVIDTPDSFENFYIPNPDVYEERFLNIKYILEKYVFTNPLYNRDAHIKQLENTQNDIIRYYKPRPTDNVITRIQQEILKLDIIPHIPYDDDSYKKIFYCQRCGRLEVIYYFQKEPYCSDEDKLKRITKKCECGKEYPLFSKERKSAKMIESEEIFHAENDISLLYLNDKEILRTQPKEPKTGDDLRPSIFNYYWNKYIDIPENKQLDRNVFEKYKNEMESFWEVGGYSSIPAADYATGANSQKPASVIGRAAVGGVVAGPAGAVVGALSAVDKNNRNK